MGSQDAGLLGCGPGRETLLVLATAPFPHSVFTCGMQSLARLKVGLLCCARVLSAFSGLGPELALKA